MNCYYINCITEISSVTNLCIGTIFNLLRCSQVRIYDQMYQLMAAILEFKMAAEDVVKKMAHNIF